eukprot:m.77564 g.77564  ORF g.77564 m.77564 type:complete len:807 (-) comp14471_c0_seq1:58-2478(-)
MGNSMGSETRYNSLSMGLLDDGDNEAQQTALRHRDNKNVYETLDYDRCDNQLYRDRFVGVDAVTMRELKKEQFKVGIQRWAFCAAIGALTAIVAFFIDYSVRNISAAKFRRVDSYVQQCTRDGRHMDTACLATPWIILVLIDMAFVGLAACLTVFLSPAAAGSGIPEIKCTLNGIKRAEWLTLKTLCVKVFGVIFGVSATMPIGKEGPMIHSGAAIAAGLPFGKSTRLGLDVGILRFRSDREKRDFISAGASAGVSAAFGAQIGGVLFSLEEGASFWNQKLTWRSLFCSMTALFVLRFLISGTEDHNWGRLASGGLLSFGQFFHLSSKQNRHCSADVFDSLDNCKNCCSDPTNLWFITDLFMFVIMGLVGGLAGVLWVHVQKTITVFRMKYIQNPYLRVAEALLICFLNTTILYWAAFSIGTCHPRNTAFVIKEQEGFRDYFCKDGDYNDFATLVLNPFDASIKHLLHQDQKEQPISLNTSAAYFFIMALISCWTYGLMIPSGLFVPALVTGAAYGRFVGTLMQMSPTYDVYVGTYSLIGAAAFLGGVVRMTISLTVILVEATNEVTYGLPVLITLICSKLVGDFFGKGIYDVHIDLKEIPLLEWEAETDMHRFLCSDVMARNIDCVQRICRVGDLVQMLKDTSHNGFPVVGEADDSGSNWSFPLPVPEGRFRGIILRSQIITLLDCSVFGNLVDNVSTDQVDISIEDFAMRYPQRTAVERLALSADALEKFIDLGPYFHASPYTVTADMPLPRVFEVFRYLGLRHLPVLDDQTKVIGMVTREELTEHKIHHLTHAFEFGGHGADH